MPSLHHFDSGKNGIVGEFHYNINPGFIEQCESDRCAIFLIRIPKISFITFDLLMKFGVWTYWKYFALLCKSTAAIHTYSYNIKLQTTLRMNVKSDCYLMAHPLMTSI